MKHAPEIIERVRQLAATALTAREIAERAGLCSKDAVIGICNRYGIKAARAEVRGMAVSSVQGQIQ